MWGKAQKNLNRRDIKPPALSCSMGWVFKWYSYLLCVYGIRRWPKFRDSDERALARWSAPRPTSVAARYRPHASEGTGNLILNRIISTSYKTINRSWFVCISFGRSEMTDTVAFVGSIAAVLLFRPRRWTVSNDSKSPGPACGQSGSRLNGFKRMPRRVLMLTLGMTHRTNNVSRCWCGNYKFSILLPSMQIYEQYWRTRIKKTP